MAEQQLMKAISGSFLNYLHLPFWLDQKVKNLISGRRAVKLGSIREFWLALFEDRLKHGDRVRFDDAFVCEWVPRLPGELWYKDFAGQTVGLKEMRGSGKGSKHLRPEDLTEIRLLTSLREEPVGVMRYPLQDHTTQCATLCLTTHDYWCADLGVPLVVSTAVYDAFARAAHPFAAVETSIEAILQFGDIPTLAPGLIRSIGAEIDESYLTSIVTPLGAPTVYLAVVSPLSVRFRTHNKHPYGTLWSIWRRTASSRRARHGVSEHVNYVMSSLTVDFGEKDQFDNAVRYFQGEPKLPDPMKPRDLDWFYQTIMSGDRLGHDDGDVKRETLTEFDGRRRLLSARIPIVKHSWDKPRYRDEILRVLTDLRRQQEKPRD